MNLNTAEQKRIDQDVLEVGKSALHLLQRFLSGRVTRAELVDGLAELKIKDFINGYWGIITSDTRFVPHWHVLQILSGLAEDIDYQLSEHGPSTLHEDVKDIAVNLKRISERA